MRKLNTTHSRESFNPYEESSMQDPKGSNQASHNGIKSNQQNTGSNIQLQNSQHCNSFRRKASIASGQSQSHIPGKPDGEKDMAKGGVNQLNSIKKGKVILMSNQNGASSSFGPPGSNPPGKVAPNPGMGSNNASKFINNNKQA